VPFVIEDVTPREMRVPTGEAAVHENGALGVLSLVIGDPEPGRVLDWIEQIGGVRRDGWTVQAGGCRLTVENSAAPRIISATIGCGDKEPVVLI
jgi:hypothetical protein